jgi:hypothetical protein
MNRDKLSRFMEARLAAGNADRCYEGSRIASITRRIARDEFLRLG